MLVRRSGVFELDGVGKVCATSLHDESGGFRPRCCGDRWCVGYIYMQNLNGHSAAGSGTDVVRPKKHDFSGVRFRATHRTPFVSAFLTYSDAFLIYSDAFLTYSAKSKNISDAVKKLGAAFKSIPGGLKIFIRRTQLFTTRRDAEKYARALRALRARSARSTKLLLP